MRKRFLAKFVLIGFVLNGLGVIKGHGMDEMTTEVKETDMKPHSAEYFGRSRDYWWNSDFLKLMGERWNIKSVQNLLDVGCGVGHWSMALHDILPNTAKVVGVDREIEWVSKAQERATLKKLGDRYAYQQGDVNRLPFPDESFDMVTCQTVLIHVPDVSLALSEMTRVLKKGGILVTIEPNNVARPLALSTLDLDSPIDEILGIVRFEMTCERGKKALNEGYISIGDQLPGYFSSMGLTDIKVYISDKAKTFYPPYDTPEQQATIEEIKEWSKKDFWIWDKSQTKKYYEAGKGDMQQFEDLWLKCLHWQNDRFLSGVQNNTYATSGGKVMYCISARK